ncbi:alpha/beta hydrolase [Kordiimonas sp. SCSIO 12610]|uniref:alpha/beta hydrolase n=1 Tax=Kordiimonas sp. SCSIO 12610 TaxID=2829597 RepID=UPI00210E4ED1|nr:alpha/beta hydrolase-fold protein [Kordiimonas sp. SCSIO 12610]UTW56648.1 alpha/beta hydrolase [Kordiimonas sp. SCSIO 12610]
MRLYILRLLIVCTLFLTQALDAEDHKKAGPVKIGDRYSFTSKILKEKQIYSVALPRSYFKAKNKGKRYPVLYILDGYKNTFHMVSGIVEKLSRANNSTSDVPELIIVALPSNNRFRDYTPTKLLKEHYGKNAPDWFDDTGGADKYLSMLEFELMPEIQQTFRTNGDDSLAGHSLGGLLALHDMLGGRPRFDRYIALDASWWYDNRLMERTASKLTFLGNSPIRLYMALAGSPDQNHTSSALDFDRVLKTKKLSNLTHTLQRFPSENHNSIDLQGYYNGLKWVFEGYGKEEQATR